MIFRPQGSNTKSLRFYDVTIEIRPQFNSQIKELKLKLATFKHPNQLPLPLQRRPPSRHPPKKSLEKKKQGEERT